MSRSTSTSSATITANPSQSLSVKSAPVAAVQPSNVKQFLTNLRLLNLDLRTDWPGITAQTFSTKNANQKSRIQCVEWSLFRLFEIWDGPETREKLRPFFPPLEPLQSLNLRAALYRSLNELKKNGILSRESVLRKTMLDECKGDKFIEVLVSFSNAVLKKISMENRGRNKHAAVAKKLATDPTLSSNWQASLLPLAIAHKAALVALLKTKQKQKVRYLEFSLRLDEKMDEVNQRNMQCQALNKSRKGTIQQKDAEAVKRQLEENWIGNTKWLDTMLHGAEAQADDAFLNLPFRGVWRTVESGRPLHQETTEASLLESLESRVNEQQIRLRKWNAFHADMLKNRPLSVQPAVSNSNGSRLDDLKFDDHLKIRLRPNKAPESRKETTKTLDPKYQNILSEMEENLLQASKSKRNRIAISQPQLRRGSSYNISRSPDRHRKSRSDSVSKKLANIPLSDKVLSLDSPQRKQGSSETIRVSSPKEESLRTPTDSETTLVGNTRATWRPPLTTSDTPESSNPQPKEEAHHQATMQSYEPSILEDPVSSSPQSPDLPSLEFPSEPPISQEDQLAEQIISSIGDATPSPVKKPRPSLMERVQISMAHASAFKPPSPIQESSLTDVKPLPELPKQSNLDRRTSLLERTRQSMSLMSAQPRPKPRKSTAPQSRQSLYPVNQFETPRKQPIPEKKGDSTPKEDLFSDEIDYDRVFKSRPKIAQSPVFSPQVEDDNVDDSMIDLVGDMDEEGDVTGVWESSPLKKMEERGHN